MRDSQNTCKNYGNHPLPDEDGKLDISWAKLQMITSVDYNAGSKFLNWTLGGFNAHALHHILPNVSHIHYLNILPIFKEVAARHKIVYMDMPYKKALAAYYRFLYKMGHQIKMIPSAYEMPISEFTSTGIKVS